MAQGKRPSRAPGRPPGQTPGETKERLLRLLLAEHSRTGLWPGKSTLAERLGVDASVVIRHRQDLIEVGRLPKEAARGDRLFRVQEVSPSILIIGRTMGGPPALAVEESEAVDLSDLVTGGGQGCFGCVVDGDSLDGPPFFILPGSIAVIRPQATANEGQVVLVRIPDELTGESRTTLKQFFRADDGSVVLRSSNPAMPELHPEQVEVLGVCITVVRRLDR